MPELYPANADILLVEQDGPMRQNIRDILRQNGFDRVRDFDSLSGAGGSIQIDVPDLLFIDAKLGLGPTQKFVSNIRRHELGTNPFVPIIATLWTPEAETINGLVDAGVDDLAIKPISLAQLMDRIDLIVNNRKPFVVTAEFIGPDRRTGERVDAEAIEIPQIPVPTTLAMKARGEDIDPYTLQKSIAQTMDEINNQRLLRIAYQIGFSAKLIGESGDMPNKIKERRGHAARLVKFVDEMSSRVRGTGYETLLDICNATRDLAEALHKEPRLLDERQVIMLKSLSDALVMSLDPSKDTGTFATEIASMVKRFAHRARFDAALAAAE